MSLNNYSLFVSASRFTNRMRTFIKSFFVSPHFSVLFHSPTHLEKLEFPAYLEKMSSLLHVTLAKSSSTVYSVFGDFTGRNGGDACELCIARPAALELYRIDDTGKLHCISIWPIFAVLRAASIMHIADIGRDCLGLGTDSGYASIVTYDAVSKGWNIVASAGYGRVGCLKDTPGQYVAGDRTGRAIMVASLESQFVAYSVGAISNSPQVDKDSKIIDAYSSGVNLTALPYKQRNQKKVAGATAPRVCFALCAVDVGTDTDATFASIEAYSGTDGPEKKLVFYQVSSTSGTLVKSGERLVDLRATSLIAIPKAKTQSALNGSVLVCGEGFISFYAVENEKSAATTCSPHSELFVTGAAHLLASVTAADGSHLFVLVQSEVGVLYKVLLSCADQTIAIKLAIYEGISNVNAFSDAASEPTVNSIPLCNSLAISKSGLLFCAGESGSQNMYAISSLGSGKENQTSVSLQNLQLVDTLNSRNRLTGTAQYNDYYYSSGPVMDMFCDDLLGVFTPQIYALCGSGNSITGHGNSSHLRISKKGCAALCLGTSILSNPGQAAALLRSSPEYHNATGIWIIPNSNVNADSQDRFIVVSFTNSTTLLSVDHNNCTVAAYVRQSNAELDDCAKRIHAINTARRTLNCCLLADDCLLQVHEDGLTHISQNGQVVSHWEIPSEFVFNRTIEHVSCNGHQLVITLCTSGVDASGIAQVVRGNGGGANDIIYFELDASIGQLVDCGNVHLEGKDVSCVDVGEAAGSGSQTVLSKNLAVGFWDGTVQLISLDTSKPKEYLKEKANVTFSDRPSSVCFYATSKAHFLHVGCINGELIRLKLDVHASTNVFSVASQQLLSSALYKDRQALPVTLNRVRVKDSATESASCGVIASSTLTILIYSDAAGIKDTIIPVQPLQCCCSMLIKRENDLTFSLLTVTEGRKFNILALSSVSPSSSDVSSTFTNSNSFSHVHVPLQCTPRKMAPIALAQGSTASKAFVAIVQADHVGTRWNSFLSLIDPNLSGEGAVVDTFAFDQNKSTAAFSVCVVETTAPMAGKYGLINPIIIVGSATEMDVTAGVGSCYTLHSFTTRCHRETGKWTLLLLHSISLDEFPRTMSCFWPADDSDDQTQTSQGQGRYKNLLVGSDNMLYLFEVNKGANLVKKCELNLGTKRSHLSVVKSDDANKTLSNYHKISRISVHGSRIFVGDSTNSVSFVKYNRIEKRFVLFAEDQECPRFVSALASLDRDSVGGGDRFGNVFTLQLQDGIDDDVDVQDASVHDDGFGAAEAEAEVMEEKMEQKLDGKKRSSSSKEAAAAQRSKHPRTENNEGLLKCHFYVGESITTVCTTRSQLFTGYRVNSVSNSNIDSSIKAGSRGYFNNSGSVLITGTIGGGLSAFVPLRDDFVFFYMNLESCIRNCTGAANTKRYDGDTFGGDELKKDFSASGTTSGGLCIRHHQSYRSYFQPAKGTIDGDLLLTYKLMSKAQQTDIAESLSKLILNSEEEAVSNASKLTPHHIMERIDATMTNIL